MFTLNKKYILNNFKLPGTNILVMLNGEYQPQLSDQSNLQFANQTVTFSKNMKIETPIHLLFLTARDCHTMFNIIATEGSYTTIIEEHASLGEQIYTSDIKVNIDAKARSEIVHYKLQFENITKSTHRAETNINQETDSKIISCFINKGANITTDRLWVKLMGEKASYKVRGVNLLSDQQNMTCQICIEHLVPNCISSVLTKGIIDDRSVSNFDCRVIAHSNAVKTETHVLNKNLLLSEKAVVNTAPELEVYVDDVTCTHGATVGELDKEALFYLRSRGIAKNMAIKILTNAFIQEITTQFAQYSRYKIAAGLVYE
ncbi:MAG: SufD family Fe-S cluster assembly protein [Coxiellaceae bacterium]|jgi:Fe-S cluster assembly protein SufD|nr:SufD family Fe-S cluster assembly protein [Coxiellaceae bacterium]